MVFNKDLAGKYVKVNNGTTYWVNGSKVVGVSLGTPITVVLSGWFTTNQENTYYHTTGERSVLWDQSNVSLTGKTQSAQPNESQKYIDGIIKNNKRILENNLICATYKDKLTTDQRNLLYNLQLRLTERDQRLRKDGVVQDIKTGSPKGYNLLSNNLEQFMNNMQSYGVGSLTLTSIVVYAVVIAALSTAAYWLYQYYFGESNRDVKFSDDLTKILTNKLTAEEYQRLINETKGLVNKAVISERFGNFLKSGITKIALFGVLGYIGYNYYLKTKNKTVKS